MTRKLAGFGLAFTLAELAAAYLPPSALGLTAALFVLCLLILTIRRRDAARYWLPAAAGIGIGLVWSAAFRLAFIAPVQRLAGTSSVCTAVVQTDCESAWEAGSVRATLHVTQLDGQPVDFKAQCSALPYSLAGDVVVLRLRFAPLDADSYRISRLAKSVYLSAVYEDGYAWQGSSNAMSFRLYRLRQALAKRLYRFLPADLAGLEAAVLLGDRTGLPDETSDAFRAAGISHLLAVSGLHVALLCGLFGFGARQRFSRPVVLCQAAVLLFYMGLTGLPFSVLRAGVMFLLTLAGCFLLQPPDAVTSLALAAVLIGVCQPYAPCDIGFQLSCCGVLGVQAASGLSSAQVRFLRQALRPQNAQDELPFVLRLALRGWGCVQTAVLACAATLPVLLLHGMMTSGVSVLANLLVVWMLGPALRLGLAALLCSSLGVLEPLFRGVCLLLGLWLRWMVALTRWCAGLPFARLSLPEHYTVWVLAVLAVLALWLRHRKCLRYFFLTGTICLAAAVWLGVQMQRDVVRLTLTGTAGNGCAILTQNGKAAVLFRGGASNANAVERWLAANGAPELTAVIDLRTDPSKQWLDAPEYYTIEQLADGTSAVLLLDTLQADLYHDGDGNMVIAAVGDWHAALCSGDPKPVQPVRVDVFLAGGSLPEAVRPDAILSNQQSPKWLAQAGDTPVFYGADAPQAVIRPGRSVIYKEVQRLAVQ